jgi:hypothetical protein
MTHAGASGDAHRQADRARWNLRCGVGSPPLSMDERRERGNALGSRLHSLRLVRERAPTQSEVRRSPPSANLATWSVPTPHEAHTKAVRKRRWPLPEQSVPGLGAGPCPGLEPGRILQGLKAAKRRASGGFQEVRRRFAFSERSRVGFRYGQSAARRLIGQRGATPRGRGRGGLWYASPALDGKLASLPLRHLSVAIGCAGNAAKRRGRLREPAGPPGGPLRTGPGARSSQPRAPVLSCRERRASRGGRVQGRHSPFWGVASNGTAARVVGLSENWGKDVEGQDVCRRNASCLAGCRCHGRCEGKLEVERPGQEDRSAVQDRGLVVGLAEGTRGRLILNGRRRRRSERTNPIPQSCAWNFRPLSRMPVDRGECILRAGAAPVQALHEPEQALHERRRQACRVTRPRGRR